MTSYPAWTPAPRPGIIPLHPLSFGVILGRSFSALRQNPKVLLGFALVVQTVAILVATAGIVAVGFATFGRLASLRPGTDEFETVLAGSIAISGATALVLSLASGALGVLVQGVVVSEVAHAVVAEKHTLGALWRRVKPVAWRLIAYSALVFLIVAVVIGVLAAGVIGLAVSVGPAAIVLAILLALSAIPLSLWLSTKLLLVPSVIVLEQASVFGAIGRSWRLTRGRFWPTLGIIVIISMSFGILAQVISVPFSFVTMGLTSVITPTGDPEPGQIIALLVGTLFAQAFVTLIQTIAVIVQSTAGALVYIDCRMRREDSTSICRRTSISAMPARPRPIRIGETWDARWTDAGSHPGPMPARSRATRRRPHSTPAISPFSPRPPDRPRRNSPPRQPSPRRTGGPPVVDRLDRSGR